MVVKTADLAFATPRKLPRAADLRGRVVVLDVAFASEASGGGFEKLTKPFIEGLGKRLVAWVDHHDHLLHEKYKAGSAIRSGDEGRARRVSRDGHDRARCAHRRRRHDRLSHRLRRPLQRREMDVRREPSRIRAPTTTRARSTRASGRRARSRSESIAPFARRPRDTALFGADRPAPRDEPRRDASLWTPIDEAGAQLAGLEAEDARASRSAT